MHKNITIAIITIILLLMLVTVCALASTDISEAVDNKSDIGYDMNLDKICIEFNHHSADELWVAEPVFYDASTDYMKAMVSAFARSDMAALSNAISARNAKIAGLDTSYDVVTLEDFIANFEHYSGFSMNEDYMKAMKQCCLSGDADVGREAERKRNKKLDALNMSDAHISYDDLLLLAKIITWEAGSSWLSEEWKMTVGEVLMNHVASPEFPDTLYDCVYQPGCYEGVMTARFSNLIPFEDCVNIAARLLSGERIINDTSVVFQAAFRQGSGVYKKFYDDILGTTYICYSTYPELYQE